MNILQKKKLKSKEKSLVRAETIDLQLKMKNMCRDFKMINTTQAIVRQKLRRDEVQLKKDMKSICKDLERVLDTKVDQEDSDQLEVAVVEDLACKVDHLMISQEELTKPGFVFTRWQQRKFMERLNKNKRRGVKTNVEEDLDHLSSELCCQSPNLCTMHSQNLFHDL